MVPFLVQSLYNIPSHLNRIQKKEFLGQELYPNLFFIQLRCVILRKKINIIDKIPIHQKPLQ